MKQRLRDIGEARIAIARIASGAPDSPDETGATAIGPRRNLREALAWSAAGAALLVTLGIGYFGRAGLPADSTRGVVRVPFVSPDNAALEGLGSTVVSPDGLTLLFSGRSADGTFQLWVRLLDSMEAAAVTSYRCALRPFWSPDSRSVGFGAGGKLKRVDSRRAGAHRRSPTRRSSTAELGVSQA